MLSNDMPFERPMTFSVALVTRVCRRSLGSRESFASEFEQFTRSRVPESYSRSGGEMSSVGSSGSSATPASDPPSAGDAAEVHVHYVVRLTQNDSVCIVRSDQIQPSAGPDLAIGAGCEVVTHGGTQEAVIIGVGSEAAITVLENCLKTTPPAPTAAATQLPPIATDATVTEPPSTSKPSPADTGSGKDGRATVITPGGRQGSVGVASERGHKGYGWTSELAALLSPATSSSAKPSLVAKSKHLQPPEKLLPFKQPQKRSAATDTGGSPAAKKKKVEEKKVTVTAKTAVIPTVVPARPQIASMASLTKDEKSATKKLSREIEPPPRVGEKTDTLSQILHELHELKRSFSTLAGSLLIVRRNQDDIKTRLTEIGISIVTHSSDPILLPNDSTATITEDIDHHDDSLPLNASLQADGDSLNVGIVMGDPDNPHTLQGIDLVATFPEFDPEYLIVSRGKSCSRRNFAVNLVRYLFTSEEMAQSNCSGTRGKSRLEQERIAIVRRTTFVLWPVGEREELRSEWAKCIYSIDEACRRLNRPKFRKKKEFPEENLLQPQTVEQELDGYMDGDGEACGQTQL